MKNNILILCICMIGLINPAAFSQYQGIVYEPLLNASIFHGSKEQSLGFAGGFNNPQFAMGDLNNDGKQDLVIFERGSEWIRTFINTGTAGNPDYRYRPQYAKHFPQAREYLKLVDYNCDNIPDLIHRGNNGFSIYKGYYNTNNELSFNYYKDLFYSPLKLFQEGMESASFPPPFGWTMVGVGWSRKTTGVNPTCSPYANNGMVEFNSDVLPVNSTALFISKLMRISPNLGSHAQIGFWIYRDGGSPLADSVSVYINDQQNLTANAVYIGRVARARTIPQPDIKSADGWYKYEFDIPGNVVGDNLFIIFKGISKGGNNIYIDNIEWVASDPVGDINAYVEPSDLPTVADVDNDGDLDFFSFYIAGSYISFYKNYQVEDNLPCDSIRVNLKEACWGKVAQGFVRTQTLGMMNCPGVPIDPGKPAKPTHAGNTLCLADEDGDGDYDYFNGSVSFPDIQFLENGKADYNAARDTIIYQDTLWQKNGAQMNLNHWPATFWLDIDQDGDNDLLFAPHAIGISEDIDCVKWYENQGTTAAPNYIAQPTNIITANAIDRGTVSYPILYDYNKDGKPDLFIGNAGKYNGGIILKSSIAYYENKSTLNNIRFELIDNDFLNLNSQNIEGAAPAVGDLDNDGKEDLVIGHTNGTISFYKNMAGSNMVSPVWQLSQNVLKDMHGIAIDSASHAAPFIYDIDKDGKKDLLIGYIGGRLFLYRNTGGANQLNLQYHTRNLGNVKVDGNNIFSAFSTPYVGRIDNVPKDYLVLGSSSGRMYRFTGFQNGNMNATYLKMDSAYSFINENLTSYSGFRSAPFFGDLDGDGKYEMILGNHAGGITIFKQMKNVTENVNTGEVEVEKITVFPNPAKENLYISLNNRFAPNEVIKINVYNAIGQCVKSLELTANPEFLSFSVSDLAAGIYFIRIQSPEMSYLKKVNIVK